MIQLILPLNNSDVSILSDECRLFYDSEELRIKKSKNDNSLNWRSPKMKSEDCSKPLPVKMQWSDEGNTLSGVYVVIVSEKSDLSDPIIRISDKCEIDFYNLCVGTKYYWCVQKACFRSDIWSFTVSDDSPRLLNIDGLGNVRDIGGYNVPLGRIRQKMIYRGCEFDNNLQITSLGIDEFMRLNVKTEFDLRSDEPVFKPGHSIFTWYDIEYILLPVGAYKYMSDMYHMNLYKTIMLKLTDESAYPVYIHCVAGADRTGTVVFLIEALLGMSEKDLFNEYELTSISRFGERSRNGNGMQEILSVLNQYDGNTVNEKVENYMLQGLRLTKAQIKKIREIMIE